MGTLLFVLDNSGLFASVNATGSIEIILSYSVMAEINES